MRLFTTTAGIVIAFFKRGFVVWLFMEFAEARVPIRLTAMAAVVFLAALFALILSDVLSRLAAG
jgi:hypothetical protein